MLGVHQQADEVVAVGRQAVKYTDTHVIAATQLGAVHGLGVVAIVALGPRRVQGLIVLAVIGFLEQDIGADAGGFELFIGLDLGSGDIDVQATDFTVTHLSIIDSMDGLQDVLERVHHGVLTSLKGDALVSHLDQSFDFGTDLVL